MRERRTDPSFDSAVERKRERGGLRGGGDRVINRETRAELIWTDLRSRVWSVRDSEWR